MKISLSELDETRFGVVTAKATFEAGDVATDALRWSDKNKVQLLIARVPTEQINLVQELEQAGFMLTDTLVYYKNNNLTEPEEDVLADYVWRIADPADAKAVAQLAACIFAGYGGHYHADRRLKKSDCDLVYVSWAENACLSRQSADVVLLATYKLVPVGFLTIKKMEAETKAAEIVLNGVHPDFQGKGIYHSLIVWAKKWAIEQQLKELTVSTQVTNLAVQKVWCRQGFLPYKSVYTFHKWFT